MKLISRRRGPSLVTVLRHFVLIMAGLAAASCSNRPDPACPSAAILADAANVTKFRDGSGRDLTDVVVEGEIVNIAVGCSYDRRGVSVDLQVAIAGTRGPADRSRAAEFDYFVAVTDAERNVLAKEIFRVRVRFADNQTRVGQVEEIEPRIPHTDPAKAARYQILVGFQLTPDEIAWNRKRRDG